MRDRFHAGKKDNMKTSYCNWRELYYTELERKSQKSFHMVVLKADQQNVQEHNHTRTLSSRLGRNIAGDCNIRNPMYFLIQNLHCYPMRHGLH